jgi:hypothetical protein
VRQQKAAQLKQVVSESKLQNCNKFNKFIFTLFTGKIGHDQEARRRAESQSGEKRGLESIHKVIEHLMDAS